MHRRINLMPCGSEILRSIRKNLSGKCNVAHCLLKSISSAVYGGEPFAMRTKFTDNQRRHCSSDLLAGRTTAERTQSLKVSCPIQKDYLKMEEVVSILHDSMCEDLCVIKVDLDRSRFRYVDYFVVTSGRSVRHLKSMAFLLCSKFKERVREVHGASTAVVEGEDCNDWLVLDIGNIVIHFMLPEAREKYELEKLWTLGPEFDDQLQKLLSENKPDKEVLLPFKPETLIEKKLKPFQTKSIER